MAQCAEKEAIRFLLPPTMSGVSPPIDSGRQELSVKQSKRLCSIHFYFTLQIHEMDGFIFL